MADSQSIKDRILLALKRSNKSQRDLAKHMRLASPTVSAMLKRAGDPPMRYIEAVSDLTNFASAWIIYGEVAEDVFAQIESDSSRRVPEEYEEEHSVAESSPAYLKGDNIRTIAVTVDKSGKELMSFVPVRAQAGYMKGYGDPHFIENLPAFSLPTFTEGSYRMFQVDGNSMLQLGGGGLHDGDIVISHYLEDFFSIRDNRVYVVVCAEGVVVKRCLNRLKSADQALILKSDNKNGDYPDMVLHASEILEVWELKAFISRQLSFATDLWEVINDLQAQQALVNNKLKAIEGGTAETKKSIKRAR